MAASTAASRCSCSLLPGAFRPPSAPTASRRFSHQGARRWPQLGLSVRAAAATSAGDTASAERPLWLPGSTAPEYLDGSLPGDFGFDPLQLGKDPQDLRWYVQAELVHARFAMAGVAGILYTDLLRVTGLKDLPVWFEAGATKFEFADTRTLFFVQLLLMGFVETKRYMDFKSPGSQAAKDTFFGLEAGFEGLGAGYPAGPFFNPLGFAKDLSKDSGLRLKEIKNGRLAMVSIVGFFVQASITKVGPLENLVQHLSDPWHNTILQTLSHLGS